MKFILWTIFLVCLSGCVTYPPAKIENGQYIHPKYEISMITPKNWIEVEETPVWFRKDKTPKLNVRGTANVDPIAYYILFKQIMFLDKENIGIITIKIYKSIIDYSKLPKQKIQEMALKSYEKEKSFFDRNKYISDYSSNINAVYCSETPSLLAERRFHEENDTRKIQYILRNYIYTYKEDDTCTIELILMSDATTLEKNLKVYNTVSESIKRFKVLR